MSVPSVFLSLMATVVLTFGCDSGSSATSGYPTNIGVGMDAAATSPDGAATSPDGAAADPSDVGTDPGADPDAGADTDPGAAADADAPATCSPPTSDTCSDPAPNFMNTIAPILDARCNTSGCHDPNVVGGQWPLHAYLDVWTWAASISQDLIACSMPPPDAGVALTETERQLLFAWLACGAPPDPIASPP